MALPPPLSESASRSLRTVLARGAATRPEIAEALGVTKQTVSNAVAELEERGLVEVVAVQQGRVGRTALRYGLHRNAGWVAGMDLGASRIRVAAARLDGGLVAQRSAENPAPTVVRDWPDQLERAAVVLAGLTGELTEAEGGLLGVVIAVPRAVPVVRDLVGDRLDDADASLLAALAPVAPAAVWTENDVNCGALAQPPTPAASTLYLHVGVGLGSALIVDGRVLRGARGRAGEIAGLPSPVPGAGRTAEAALGAEGLLAAAGHSLAAPLVGSVDDLFAAAGLGDPAADAALGAEARGIASLARDLGAFVDPDVVVLSGLIGGRRDLLPRVSAECRALGVAARLDVDPLGDAATVEGAARLASELVLAALAPA